MRRIMLLAVWVVGALGGCAATGVGDHPVGVERALDLGPFEAEGGDLVVENAGAVTLYAMFDQAVETSEPPPGNLVELPPGGRVVYELAVPVGVSVGSVGPGPGLVRVLRQPGGGSPVFGLGNRVHPPRRTPGSTTGPASSVR